MHTSQKLPVGEQLTFCLALVRAYAALSRRFDGRLGTWHGISFGDFTILLALSGAPGARLRRVDLADQLGVTASGVTRALIPLEKIGLVSRKPDPNDARVGFATLTAAGRRILEEALESAELISSEIVAAGDQDVGECATVLDRISGRTDAPRGETNRPRR